MTERKNLSLDFAELRRLAEKQLQARTIHPGALSPEDCDRLFFELQVHQIELEMQNEELRRSQVQLAESRNIYADLYDFAPLGYLTLDARGKIVAANLTAASLMRLERGRLVGTFFPHYLEKSDRRRLHQLLKRLPDQQEQQLEVSFSTGEVDRTILLNILAIEDTQERQQCRVALTDITVLKQTQEELRCHKEELAKLVEARTEELLQVNEKLRETKENLEAVFRASPLAIGVFDPEGRVVEANPASERILGWKLAEIRGLIVPSIPPEAAADSLGLLQRVRQGENLVGVEVKQRRRDGEIFDASLAAAPLYDRDGRLRGFVGLAEDITARKQAEAVLQTRSRVLENMAEGVIVTDGLGHIVYTNPAFDRMFGYGPGELLSRPSSILNAYEPEENLSVVKEILSRIRMTGVWEGECLNRRKDGTTFITAIRISALDINGERLYISVQEDITGRKALEQERTRLASFPELNPNPVLEVDGSGTVTYCNPAGLQTLAVLGQPGETWRFLPSDWKDLMEVGRESRDSQIYREVEINGGVFAETISFVSGPGVMRLYAWDITKRQQASEALRQAHAELERRVAARTRQLRHTVDKLLQEIGERERAEEKLRKSEEKLHLLTLQLLTAQEDERQRLAAELHDELGHALLTLRLHLSDVGRQLLPEQAELKEKMGNMLEYLQDTVEEVRRLYHALSPGDLEVLGLTAALRSLVEEFQGLYEHIDWKVDLADVDDLFSIPIQTMIYRIVQEALTNIGKHAYPEHVQVKVTKEDQQAVFVIEDDGRGFAMNDVLEGDKRGLGLAAMAQRVSLAGGIFDLWSRENQGARIIFSIPFNPVGENV